MMKFRKEALLGVAALALALLIAGVATSSGVPSKSQAESYSGPASSQISPEKLAGQSLELTPEELELFKVQPAVLRTFRIQREAVGNIDFNQELSTDVFPPVQGKILRLFASAGDDVRAGAPLYTIDSPDLVQAGSTLISAAGTLELTTRALRRAKELFDVQGFAQKDLEQAVSDQQAAEAAQKAARDAVRIFGKTEAEMDAIVAQRKIDPELVVHAPISGRVTARFGAPGMLAQPGNTPAPFTLSDVSTLWMLADVAENDFGLLRLGLPVRVTVKAYPDRTFRGTIVNIGATVDPASRRVSVRSEIKDPQHELRAGMFATFVILIGDTPPCPGVPLAGLIHEGDGTSSVWVTADRRTITKRTVKPGIEQDGVVQILEGLKQGELVSTESALFLSSALTATPK